MAGVLAESAGTTSAAFAKLLMRSFLLGTPGVPAAGMQALSHQLAQPLHGHISTRVTVERIHTASDGERVQAADRTWRVEAVVVAVSGGRVADLTPLPAVATKGLTTW